jgi:tetratricopeptide (TPR) repeat protein
VQAQPAGALRLRAGHAPRPSLAVLGLRNLSGRPDRAWMSTAIADMLGSELTAGERVRLVPGENVARMELDLGLKPGIPAPEMLARVARHLGTELVVVGSYLALGEDAGRRVRLDVRVQDVAEGETLASATDTGREEDLFELVSRTGARLRQGLGLEEPAPTLLAARSAAVPSDPEARRLYAEGLARLRRLDARGAKELLEKVVAAEPAHALAHAALSQALVQLGYEAEARAEARRAFELADVLPREERLVVTAHHQEASADWPAAIESHRLLSRLYPDDPEHGLRLAAAQNAAGHAADALQTIAGLRRVPGADDDPRLDLEECTAARLLSDYPRLRRAAQRALEKGRRRDARHLIARARREEGWALENLGQPDQAAAAFEESKRLYGLAGDPGNLAWTLQSLGVHLAGRGQLAAARQANADALEVFREIGNRNGIASALSTLAIAEWGLGRPDSARRMSEESLALYREIGDEVSVGRLLNNVGFIAHSQGDLSRATVMYEEALGRHRRFGDRRSQAVTLGNLAEIARERGDLPRAGDLVEQALALNRRIGRKGSVALSLHGLGAVEAARGHREAARRAYREALALREELGEKLFAAESRLALAELALDAERAAEAEAIARQASQELHAGQASASEAMAWSLVARARLARGDVAGAQDAVAQAVTLARQSPLQAVTLQARIADARVRTAQGRRAEARRELEAVLADAATAGRVGLQFECRIALAELALAEGHSEAGRQELVAVQREAAALQFGAVSRRAARVSSRPAPKGGVS